MGGMNLDQQKKSFGDRKVRAARQVVIQTIEDYARSTDNQLLLNLLRRLRDRQDREKAPTPKPVLTDKQRDYASIVNVVARFDRPVGTADLGRFRRRWLEYPPRDPSSGFRNRLEEVLAKMVEDGVLKATQTRSGATVYQPGPAFGQYESGPAFAAVEEGLLALDDPSVPGVSRINTSLFPRSRYKANPTLRPLRPSHLRGMAWRSSG